MTTNITEIENRLWGAADQLWANSGLAPREFSRPVLGLLFLRYAEHKFVVTERELAVQKKEGARPRPRLRPLPAGGSAGRDGTRAARLLRALK